MPNTPFERILGPFHWRVLRLVRVADGRVKPGHHGVGESILWPLSLHYMGVQRNSAQRGRMSLTG